MFSHVDRGPRQVARPAGADRYRVERVGVGYIFVKQSPVFSIESAESTMARYRVVHWQDIPSLVEAAEGDRTAQRQLSQRFQDLIDALAMRDGSTDEDAYLEGWGHGEWVERAGGPDEVADAVAAALEETFQTLLAERFLPRRD